MSVGLGACDWCSCSETLRLQHPLAKSFGRHPSNPPKNSQTFSPKALLATARPHSHKGSLEVAPGTIRKIGLEALCGRSYATLLLASGPPPNSRHILPYKGNRGIVVFLQKALYRVDCGILHPGRFPLLQHEVLKLSATSAILGADGLARQGDVGQLLLLLADY